MTCWLTDLSQQTIEIERLINEGNDMTRLYQERGVQIQTDQLPITAIVRCPLLAIRWQLANNKLRRVQMRFKSDKDFDTVSNYLLQLGLSMNGTKGALPKSKPTAPLPSPAQASPSGPSPKAIASPEEPSNRSPAGRLSCPPSRLAEISSRPYTSHSASSNTGSQLQGGTCPRPASATPAYAREDMGMSASLSGPLAPPVLFARPTSATSDILGRSHLDTSPASDPLICLLSDQILLCSSAALAAPIALIVPTVPALLIVPIALRHHRLDVSSRFPVCRHLAPRAVTACDHPLVRWDRLLYRLALPVADPVPAEAQ
jgi:hypothetical protein